jgi:acetyltransferase
MIPKSRGGGSMTGSGGLSTGSGSKKKPLEVFFAPESVAVIGAGDEPGSDGRAALWNLVSSPFGGTVFPVNPERARVLGIKSYPSIAAVPERVELAIVATPAAAVPGAIAECGAAGITAAIVLSAGFSECGADGAKLEQEVLAEARRSGMRVIGPNCLGVMNPPSGLNATVAGTMARPGNVAFLSQSGALCSAVLDWSLQALVGFSSFVSVGSMVDVGWGDLIDYLGDDPRTRSILIYMESIGDARAFLSAAREVALTKPIIVIKAGRTEPASRAAASHTGAMAGSDEVLEAAFRRSGVLRVHQLEDLFNMAEVLAKQPRPNGPRLGIVTNSGGSGVMATDALIAAGGQLAELSSLSLAALNGLLPAHWSHGNPVDLLGDASPERYARAAGIVAADTGVDGLLVILTPQAATDATATAEGLKQFAKVEEKPVLASWMGGAQAAAGKSALDRAGIPSFTFPDAAVRAFHYMWRYSYNLRGIYETPAASAAAAGSAENRALTKARIGELRQSGRTLLTEWDSKKLLQDYGIATVETRLASSISEAVGAANDLGYPVVVKVHSDSIGHKSEVGGVQLDLCDASAVRRAYRGIKESVSAKIGAAHFRGVTVQPMVRADSYELIVGCSLDPQFGPVLMFGAGGRLAETYSDRALALPPLNTTLARRTIEQTRIHAALRSAGVDLAGLEAMLVRFSELVIDLPSISEADLNPVLASRDGLLAVDALIVLHGQGVPDDLLPKPVIRPYPAQYASHWTAKSGTDVLIRPIRPEDEPLMVSFHQTLSDRSVYFRYFHPIRLKQRIAHERLVRMCFIDYSRQIALVALRDTRSAGEQELLGVGRLVILRTTRTGEFAILVSDRHQRQGLGTELLRRLLEVARQEGLGRVIGDILADNYEMLRVCEKLGFDRNYSVESGVVKAEIYLD